MSLFPAAKAKKVLAALLRIGWVVKRQTGSHKTLSRAGWSDYVFAFHNGDEIGPSMMSRVAKFTGLTPDDLEFDSFPRFPYVPVHSRRFHRQMGCCTWGLHSREALIQHPAARLRPRVVFRLGRSYITLASLLAGEGGTHAVSDG